MIKPEFLGKRVEIISCAYLLTIRITCVFLCDDEKLKLCDHFL